MHLEGEIPLTLAFGADGRHLATSSFGALRLWDVDSSEELVDLAVDTDGPPMAAFGPDDVLLCGDRSPFGDVVIRRFHLDHDELVALSEGRVAARATRRSGSGADPPGIRARRT